MMMREMSLGIKIDCQYNVVACAGQSAVRPVLEDNLQPAIPRTTIVSPANR